MRRPSLVLAALVAAGAGCTVGPDYERPKLEVPETIPESAPVTSAATQFTDDAPWEKWWSVFGEPRLDQLVAEARAGNQDLRAAVAHVFEARAVKLESYGPLFPQVSSTGAYQYQKQSKTSIILPPDSQNVTGLSAVGTPFSLYSVSADMGYELDLWGKFRRGVESATAESNATVEDARALEISLTADVVLTYFDLGTAEGNYEIAHEAVDLRERTLELVRARVKTGFAGELELRRAEGELQAALAELPEAERQRAVAQHALAILVGKMPDVHFEGGAPAAFALPPQVPIGLPATLLERRPDIRAAELRVKAANARIGQAIAEFFPQVTIAGRFGTASVSAGSFLTHGATLWSIGPAIHIPIFEGGRTYFTVLEREAATDGAVARYRSTVLNAFREVADALSGIAAHERVREHEALTVEAVERAVRLADASYRKGLTSYLNVLDAQRTLLQARRGLLQAQRQLLGDLVSLEKALGGGWTIGTRSKEDEKDPAADRGG